MCREDMKNAFENNEDIFLIRFFYRVNKYQSR